MRKQFVNNETCLLKLPFHGCLPVKWENQKQGEWADPGLSEKYCIGREISACKKTHCSEGVLLMAIGELYRKS